MVSIVVRVDVDVDVDPVYVGLLYCAAADAFVVVAVPMIDRLVATAVANDVVVLAPSFSLTVFVVAAPEITVRMSLESCPFSPISPAGIVTLRAVTSAPKYPVTAPPTLKLIAALPGPLL